MLKLALACISRGKHGGRGQRARGRSKKGAWGDLSEGERGLDYNRGARVFPARCNPLD